MTESEKRALALQIMKQEQARLTSHSPLDSAHTNLSASLRRSEARRQAYAALEQQGHTWQDLNSAYSDGYSQGKRDMITFHLTFFYCSLAIALHEVFSLSPSAIKTFIGKVESMMNDENGREDLLQRCLQATGINTTYADIAAVPDRSTRKDRQAIDRMMKTGITARDIERERESGYYYGRNSGFYLSAGYAGVALLLSSPCPGAPVSSDAADVIGGLQHDEIAAFLDHIDEISAEEISVADILERAKKEAGIDASAVATEASYKF